MAEALALYALCLTAPVAPVIWDSKAAVPGVPLKIVTVPPALVVIALESVTSPPVEVPAATPLPAAKLMALLAPVSEMLRSTVRLPPAEIDTLPLPLTLPMRLESVTSPERFTVNCALFVAAPLPS